MQELVLKRFRYLVKHLSEYKAEILGIKNEQTRVRNDLKRFIDKFKADKLLKDITSNKNE